MKNKFEPQYSLIRNFEEYDSYITNLPNFTQLRFIAKTFLDGNRAVIMPMPHKSGEYTLLVPYYLKKSHCIDGEVMGFNDQTIDQVIHYGVLKETTYRVLTYEKCGDSIPADNTIPFSEVPHLKDVIIITDYYHRNEEEPYKRSSKIGEPIWVHNSLLPLIFEEKVIVDDEIKDHPQIKVFERYAKWLSKRPLTDAFKKMMKRFLVT